MEIYSIISMSDSSDKTRFLNGVYTGGYAHFYIHRQYVRVYERGNAYEK